MTAMREADARTKWCPFARVVQYAGSETPPAGNRDSVGRATDHCNAGACCIGSDCMAWRNVELDFGQYSKNGFCGLAGKP